MVPGTESEQPPPTLPPVRDIVVVALGGGAGSVLRWLVAGPINARWPAAGTAVVNIVGSLLIGVLAGWFAARAERATTWLALGTGVLGGFTTFSTWMLESIGSLDRPARFAATVMVPVAVGMVAAWVGLRVGRTL